MSRKRINIVVLALLLVALGGAIYASRSHGLPQNDQAIKDNAHLIDRQNPVHRELADGGWGILAASTTYDSVDAGPTNGVMRWHHGYDIFTVGDRIVGIQEMKDGPKCDVPAWPAVSLPQLLENFKLILYARNTGVVTVSFDGQWVTYHCR